MKIPKVLRLTTDKSEAELVEVLSVLGRTIKRPKVIHQFIYCPSREEIFTISPATRNISNYDVCEGCWSSTNYGHLQVYQKGKKT